MILYAVELEMAVALRDEYLAWLNGHVHEMLGLPGILGADIMVPVEPSPSAGRWAVCVHYRLRDRAAWRAYLVEHAPRMRAAGIARFGDRVKATRRVLETA